MTRAYYCDGLQVNKDKHPGFHRARVAPGGNAKIHRPRYWYTFWDHGGRDGRTAGSSLPYKSLSHDEAAPYRPDYQ